MPRTTLPRQFLNSIKLEVRRLHRAEKYSGLRVMIEEDERGKIPMLTVRVYPPGVKTRKELLQEKQLKVPESPNVS